MQRSRRRFDEDARATRRAPGSLTRCLRCRSPLAVRAENLRSVEGSILPTAGVGVGDRFAAIVQRIAGNQTRCHA